jgi:hypothetical protein
MGLKGTPLQLKKSERGPSWPGKPDSSFMVLFAISPGPLTSVFSKHVPAFTELSPLGGRAHTDYSHVPVPMQCLAQLGMPGREGVELQYLKSL